MTNIMSVEFIGEHETFDLEIDHPDHQYYTSDGILTSNSHAISYAIDSYYAAWLYTYYPHEWLSTVLQSETSSADGLTKTIAEIKSLGYKIARPDVNHSGMEWIYSDEVGGFVPPLTAIKGVGIAAAREIIQHRPYLSVSDLLFDESGDWYHSKMNKVCFDALCKVEAFGSLREMKEKQIKHHRQFHEIVIGNYDKLRKGCKGMTRSEVRRFEKKERRSPPDILNVLIEKTQHVEDWCRQDKIAFSYDLTKTVSLDLLFPNEILEKLEKSEIPPVTEVRSGNAIAWFLVTQCVSKKTRKGKSFLRVKVSDHKSETTWLRIWNQKELLDKYTLWLCEVKSDPKWGLSTDVSKIHLIEV